MGLLSINNKNKKIHLVIAGSMMVLNTFAFQNCSSRKFESEISSSLDNTSAAITQPTSGTSPVVVQLPVVTPPVTPVGNTKTVFIASGHMGRTVMSCDDGKSWINDRSDNDTARCWVEKTNPNYVECDHTPYTARGLDFSGGYFYTNHGWGVGGDVKKSIDGKNWQIIQAGKWGGGIAAFGKETVFRYAEGGNWYRTTNQGVSWVNLTDQQLGFNGNQFDHPSVKRTNNKIYVIGRTPGLAISLNQGESWSYVAGFLPEYGNVGIAEGNGVIVSTGNGSGIAYVGRSLDNGQTWSAIQLGSKISKIIFNGSHFITWGDGKTYKSTDGLIWTITQTKVDGVNAPVWLTMATAYNATTGTYAGVVNVFASGYEKQKFYRSTDGVNWTTLEPTKFKGGHPISYMVTGEIDAAYCP